MLLFHQMIHLVLLLLLVVLLPADTMPLTTMSIDNTPAAHDTTDPVKDDSKLPFWSIVLIIVSFLLITVGIMYYACRKCMKRRKEAKKASGFMKGFVDFKSTALIGPSLSKQQVQPDVEDLETSLVDVPDRSDRDTKEDKDKTTDEKFGKLHYTLEYDFTKEELTVSLISASDLKAMDISGFSDPYVKVYFQHDKKKKMETRVHRKTLNPIFDEKFVFKLTYTEIQQRDLVMCVYDYDRMTKHDQIGYITKPLMGIDWCKIVDETRELLGPNEEKQALGDVCFSLRYNPTTNKLIVTVIEAKGLKKMDVGGLSDPYVKVELIMGDKRIKKCKTTIKKCTLNPYFNESLGFEVRKEDIMKVQLYVTVIDYDRIGASEPIGRVVVRPGTKHWKEMLDADKRNAVLWHTLQEVYEK